jgi:hypothetical protein
MTDDQVIRDGQPLTGLSMQLVPSSIQVLADCNTKEQAVKASGE